MTFTKIRIPRISRAGKEGVNTGIKYTDQLMLDRENPADAPKTQIYAISDDEEPEQQTNLCANCGSKLMYLERTQTFMCNSCHSISYLEEDVKLKRDQQAMKPFQSQFEDPNNDPDGEPFFVSWNPDSGNTSTNKDYEVTYSSADGRVKRIKCKSFPKDISVNAFDD
jgi:ribosomal protein S27AE